METLETLAFKFCQFNGQRGTKKQIDFCIRSFCGSIEFLTKVCKERNII